MILIVYIYRMNLRDLDYLVAVAEHLHFGKAARACNVSQPTLSMQLKKLEDTLGVQLFERSNTRVMVTPIGAEMVTRARRMLMEATGASTLDEAVQLALGRPTLAEAGRGPSPTWRLRTTPALDAAVRREAKERGISVSTLIREAVAEHIRPAS